MGRPKMLPTPASSTEIKGQDHSSKLSSLHLAFELPPSALNPDEGPKLISPTNASPDSAISMPYLQASETVKSRRRATAAQHKEFMLPPPPTRSCKIIQMKPRPQDKGASTMPSTTKGTGNKISKPKKAQPSPTSSAGRKIARKTAHSLIERRRRSKMNDEFAVLKGLIPECDGEMHKLAILQAAISYVRYLKDCKTTLEAQNCQSMAAGVAPEASELEYNVTRWQYHLGGEGKGGGEEDEDQHRDMEAADVMAKRSSMRSQCHQSPISPALTAQLYPQRSPPPLTHPAESEISPSLRPQLEIDQEASAALLMLHTWQQTSHNARNPARGISVQDLLSP